MPRRPPRPGKPQQPPKSTDVVEVFRESSGEAQQRRGGEDVVEVFRPDAAAARIARVQAGNVTRAQLRDAGLTDDQVDYRIASERLHRVHRATFLVGHDVPPERAPYFAAVAALGDLAYLSHGSALEDYGAIDRADGPIHVTVLGRCRRSRDGIRVHRTTRIGPQDIGTRDGLRISSPARAALDYAEYATPGRLSRAVNQLHVDGLSTPQDLWDVLARTPGRHGAALLKATLIRHDGPTTYRSGGERIALALLKRARLPRPETNAVVHGKEVDFLYRDAKVVIEIDGGQSHGTPAAVDNDRRKDAYLRSLGYIVLRYSYWQIDEEPEAVIAEISAELRSRSS
jgi:very-short-patch-repair endonuclease